MIVALTDIPTRGLDVQVGPWAKAACAEGLDGEVKAFEGQLTITRHDCHVLVRGELHLVGEVPCDRCGAPLLVSLGGDLSVLYSPMEAVPETVEDTEGLPTPPVQLDVPVEDVGEYDGKALDLAFVVREWVTVERPVRLTCGEVDEADDEACRERFRLRAGAGAAAPPVDPRFSKLLSFTTPSED